MTNVIDDNTVERVLDQARWAPSGDNTQPWRFERIANDHFRVHAHDTRDWCVYDLEGRASQIAVGALLETIALAAGALGTEARFRLDPAAPETNFIIDVELTPAPERHPDPLHAVIEQRTTQRRPFTSKPLTTGHKVALEAAVGEGHRIVWIEGAQRRRMARLLFRNAHIRLTIREAYEVHKRIIEWDARFSEDRIPDQALGLDALTVKSMRWAMASWERVQFLNRWLAGTWLPRLQMDLLPGLGCAAHFLLVAEHKPNDVAGHLAAGRAVQRLWLACAANDIQFQPEQTPIIFAEYARKGFLFTANEAGLAEAKRLRADLTTLVGEANVVNAVFGGRLGYGRNPTARSVRLPLPQLLIR